MELHHLRTFVAVVRHGGFTRAAEALHVAQPAVSAQVRRLETAVGATLLARTSRSVTLTRAGELVLARAERILGEVDGVRTDLDHLQGILRGHVRLGAIQALDPFDLPGALAGFVARYPGVTLALGSGPGVHLVDELGAGRLDLAIAPVRDDLPARISARTLFTEELVVITSPRHPLAGSGALELGALAEDPFVCLPADSGLRAILDREAGRAGFRPRVPFEATSLVRIRELVAHGLGVALLARSVAAQAEGRVVLHSVAPDSIMRPVGLLRVQSDAATEAVEACAEFLRSWIGPARSTR